VDVVFDDENDVDGEIDTVRESDEAESDNETLEEKEYADVSDNVNV
jgi:hypothetical protein